MWRAKVLDLGHKRMAAGKGAGGRPSRRRALKKRAPPQDEVPVC
jgi:hypothetical protein